MLGAKTSTVLFFISKLVTLETNMVIFMTNKHKVLIITILGENTALSGEGFYFLGYYILSLSSPV